MPTITIDVDHLTTAGAANLSDTGTPLIQFYPPRMVVGSAVVVADPVDVYLSAGAATVVLPANPAGTAYRAVERFPGGVTRYFRVTADAAYKDLVDIDPATLAPPTLPSAWQAALDAAIAGVSAGSIPRELLAKSPDLLITGSITRDGTGAITTAQVTWQPGNVPGTFTVLATDTSGAINSYSITYGSSPVVNTYTQPAITRDASGAATVVPAIVVS